MHVHVCGVRGFELVAAVVEEAGPPREQFSLVIVGEAQDGRGEARISFGEFSREELLLALVDAHAKVLAADDAWDGAAPEALAGARPAEVLRVEHMLLMAEAIACADGVHPLAQLQAAVARFRADAASRAHAQDECPE
jgi:hypothetical protein